MLIVEDEESMLNTLKMFFTAQGYTVFGTGMGDKALEILEKEHPHVGIYDLQLEGSPITGIEVLKQTREKYPDIKVFIVTGYADDKDIRGMCMQHNPYRIFGKPVPLAELQKEMAEIAKDIK
jgi:two-component system response regulator AtoC